MDVKQTPLTCRGHTRPVVNLDFSDITPDDYFLASACKDGKPMLRLGSTGDWIGTLEGHKGVVWSISLNKSATRAATGSGDFSAKIWDTVSGDELTCLPHKHIVKSVALSNDSVILATGGNERIIRYYDMYKLGIEPYTITNAHNGPVKHVVWSNDPRLLYSTGEDRLVKLWDVRQKEAAQVTALSDSIKDIYLSNSGQYLVICSGSRVIVYSPRINHKLVSMLALEYTAFSAACNPDDTQIVVGGDNHLVYRYELNSTFEIESSRGHFGPVHCVRFSPDGKVFASGSEDGTVRLWQTDPGKAYGLWKGKPTTTQI